MTKSQLKKKVRDQLEKVDERTLRMVDAMLTEALAPGEASYLTDDDYAELDRRVKSLEVGESKMHTWSSVKKRVLKRKPHSDIENSRCQ
jgi:putative addiction module component (TIGR02574 family)